MDVLSVLKSRGFIAQSTDEDALRSALSAGPVTAYVGFDPTASSLHVGSLVPIMAMAWLQRGGHKIIAVVGGGTSRVGDPSGKTELRQMLTDEQIATNQAAVGEQLGRFLQLDGDQGVLVNNADWLLGLNYIDFLREIGRHFSVNRMLAAEAYKQRLERGLSFIEFNYQILQAFDYLKLFQDRGCTLQMGGNDQWGNIVAGVDLVRRVESESVHALTFPLLLTATGEKMGKTARGATWLDAERLSPYDYFQYFRNVHDDDVVRLLKLYTFLDLDEIEGLEQQATGDINAVKERLALEATTLAHGAAAAQQALEGARAAFGGGGNAANVPTFETTLPRPVVELLVESSLCTSKSDARRQIQGGAVRVNEQRITDISAAVGPEACDSDGACMLWRGKKRAVRVVHTV